MNGWLGMRPCFLIILTSKSPVTYREKQIIEKQKEKPPRKQQHSVVETPPLCSLKTSPSTPSCLELELTHASREASSDPATPNEYEGLRPVLSPWGRSAGLQCEAKEHWIILRKAQPSPTFPSHPSPLPTHLWALRTPGLMGREQPAGSPAWSGSTRFPASSLMPENVFRTSF